MHTSLHEGRIGLGPVPLVAARGTGTERPQLGKEYAKTGVDIIPIANHLPINIPGGNPNKT